MAFNKTYLDEVIARSIYGTPLRSSKLLSRKLSEGEVISNIPSNGDIITITGTGFGVTAPTVLMWDTVDNQGDVYDLLPDGTNMPVRNDGETLAPYKEVNLQNRMTLESTNVYGGVGGSRNRVYQSIGDTSFGKPLSAESETQGNRSFYQAFYLKATINPMEMNSTKFFRVWDDTLGVYLRVSCSTNEMYGGVGLSAVPQETRVNDVVRGIGAANSWILCESFIDLDTTTLKTRYSNVPTGVIVDPIIRTFNPSATGIIASLVGLDDGSNTIEGEQVLIADYYCAKDYQRVILCNNPDPTLGSIREVQQVTSWSDGEIRFTLDGMRIDPANCWAIVFDKDENILSTLMIGNPTEVFQDVRYPSSVYTGSSGRCSILDTIWVCSSSDFEFECDFLIPEGSCDKVSLTYNTFTDLIEYDLINQQWNFRFGSGGTEFFGVSATTKFDTGDWVSIKVVTRVGSFDVYINGSATPEYSGSGVINVFNGNQFGRVNSGTPNTTPKLYMRNIKLTDVGTTSNSKYWKLNEQLGLRISDYSQDTNGVVTKDMSFIDNWAYLPNEGY